MKRNILTRSVLLAAPIVMIAAGLVGLTFVSHTFVSQSLAAGTNPYGNLDSCNLVNGHTIFYGWAADPNATRTQDPNVTLRAGSISASGPTTIDYKTAHLNDVIDQDHPGDPKPGSYGFAVDMGVLYKDANYPVSGTIVNVGAGANTALGIYSGTNNGADQGLTFVNNVVPANCKVNRPTSPAPSPTPSPTPAPNPTPRPNPSPTPGASPSPTPSPSAPALPSSDANAGAVAGSLSAAITVPAGGGTKVHVIYGTDPNNLNQQSSDVATAGEDAVINLVNLSPSTNYFYQIFRTNDAGQTTSSPTAQFSTANFVVQIHFTNNKSQSVSGVAASIKSLGKSGSSDKDGNVSFSDIPAGSYQVDYTYLGAAHKLAVAADSSGVSSDEAAKTSAATLEYEINVDKATVTTTIATSKPKNTAGKHPAWIIPIIVLAFVALLLILLVRRRRKQRANANQDYDFGYDETAPVEPAFEPATPAIVVPPAPPAEEPPLPPMPMPAPPTPPPLPKHQVPPTTIPLPDDSPEHMGLSLKEMVLRSMAQQKQDDRAAAAAPAPADAPPVPLKAPQAPKPNVDDDPRSAGNASHHYPWK